MIVLLLIMLLISLVELILGVLPNAPATPSAVVSGGDWIVDSIASVISVLNWVFTPALMTAIVIIVVGMFTWEYIYAATLWLLRKIPVINIK